MKFLKIIINNWPIKLLAIVAAIGLWVYAASVKISVAAFPNEIPVKALNLTPGYVAIFDQNTVGINISADSTTWNKLSTDSFDAYIDLNGFSVGTYQLPINVTTSIAGVSIVTKNPTKATVTIEPSVSKDLQVVAKISGVAETNKIAGDVVFDPAIVRVNGPKSVVDGIGQASAKITLTGEGSDFSKTITVSAENQDGIEIKNIYFSPPSVTAKVKIVSAGNVKNLGVAVATSGVPASGYTISSISTSPAAVSVIGAADSIRNLVSISTDPVNLSNQNKTIITTANLVFPLGVLSNGVSSVTVTITISSQILTKILTIPIKTTNLSSGLSISSISPSTVDITVSGSADAISGLSSGNISLILDMSSASAGSHNYQIVSGDFSLPSGINLINFSPGAVTVSI